MPMSAQVIIVVRQVGIYAVAGAVSVADVTSFWEVYGFVVQGALVPVIVRLRPSSGPSSLSLFCIVSSL